MLTVWWSSAHRLQHAFFINGKRILSERWITADGKQQSQHAPQWRGFFICHFIFSSSDSWDCCEPQFRGWRGSERGHLTVNLRKAGFSGFFSVLLYLLFWLMMWQLPLISLLNHSSLISLSCKGIQCEQSITQGRFSAAKQKKKWEQGLTYSSKRSSVASLTSLTFRVYDIMACV